MNENKFRPVPGKILAGFTLIEILVVVAVIGILAAISIALYGNYSTRARATDIVSKFDAAKTTTGANIAGTTLNNSCADVAQYLGPSAIPDQYAHISFGFEGVTNGNDSGYRPVLTVCAKAANHGAQGVKVARAAHDEFAKNMPIEAGAVLSDSVVSFALPLTDTKRVVCSQAPPASGSSCGDPVAAPSSASNPATPGRSCPSGKEVVVTTDRPGATTWGCYDPCAPGQVRNSVPPLWWCVAAPTPAPAPAPAPAPQPAAASAPAAASSGACAVDEYPAELQDGSRICIKRPSCTNPNEIWYEGDRTCHPKPATGCPQGAALWWFQGSPMCMGAGGIIPLQLAK